MSYGRTYEYGTVNDVASGDVRETIREALKGVTLVRTSPLPAGLTFPLAEEEPLLWEGDNT